MLAVFLTLCWTLFALSSVSVKVHSTTKNLNVTEQEIVEAADFDYGSCVFFDGKNKYIKKINEYASKNPNFAYLRVTNIETKFPNKYVIHFVEREELFAIEFKTQFLICDRDLRVLRVVDEFSSQADNAILLNGLKIEDEEIKVGQFLNVEQEGIKKFYSNMLKNNRDFGQMIAKFKQIDLSDYRDEITDKQYVSMSMTTFAGKKMIVNNIDFAFANKLQKLFAVESSIYNQNVDENGNILDKNGNVVYVVKNDKGEYISYDVAKNLTDENDEKLYDETDKLALTYEIISKCDIKVDNLTLTEHIKRTEKDIFYCFVEKI